MIEKKIYKYILRYKKNKCDCAMDADNMLVAILFLHECRADEGRLEVQQAGGADTLHWPPTKIM